MMVTTAAIVSLVQVDTEVDTGCVPLLTMRTRVIGSVAPTRRPRRRRPASAHSHRPDVLVARLLFPEPRWVSLLGMEVKICDCRVDIRTFRAREDIRVP